MAGKAKTTADLRETLFETIDGVIGCKIAPENALIVVKLSTAICETADLEIRYGRAQAGIDVNEAQIDIGAVTLIPAPREEK